MNVLKNLVNFWLARCVRVALWQSEKPQIFKTMNEGAGTERDLKIAEIHILKGAMKFIGACIFYPAYLRHLRIIQSNSRICSVAYTKQSC